jgi:group I intron endonuclease
MSIVYAIHCMQNERIYIGVTAHPEKRKQQHFAKLRKNIHHNKPLQASFNKYGEADFVFETLREFSDYNAARSFEGALLKEYFNDGLFNTTDQSAGFMVGNKSKTGMPCSPETKAKIGAANRGRRHTEESRRKISLGLMGNTFTKGKKQSAEAIEKKRLAGKRPNSGQYVAYTFYTKDSVTYAGSKAASVATGVPRTTLMKYALRGKNGWSIETPAVATPVGEQ